jgi:hypothetical protein
MPRTFFLRLTTALLMVAACAKIPASTTPPVSPDATTLANGGGGGGTDTTTLAPAPACTSNRTYFAREVWAPFMGTTCFKCHAPDGVAVARDRSKFVLQPPAYPGFLEENLASLKEISKLEYDGRSVLLRKPLGELDHGGGPVVDEGGPEYRALVELVSRFKKPDTCVETATTVSLDGVTQLTPAQTFRKAALHLNGRLPTADEKAALAARGEAALSESLDALMREDAFLDRVEEFWNDILLTDRFAWNWHGWPIALYQMNDTDFPGVRAAKVEWEATRWSAYTDEARRNLNDGLGREPLHLVRYVVANDKPFSDILTAPYALVDDDLAKLYAINDGLTGLREAQVKLPNGTLLPHAGLLTTPMFLNRWQTTPTNRSRARARFVLKNFLATDILKIADRPIDITKVTQKDNPTLNASQCTVCHRIIDPIAGTFRGWDENDYERFQADRAWHDDMNHPGFGKEDLPSEAYGAGLPWLARQIVDDHRFDRAVVQQIFTALTGHKPLDYPSAGAGFDDAYAAWSDQDVFFRKLSDDFQSSGRNYRQLVKAVVLSPQYRAVAAPGADERTLGRLGAYGTGRLVSPEVLNRKLAAVTGVRWRMLWDWQNNRDWLNDRDTAMLFGAIDSESVVERNGTPNGVMSNLAWRIAAEMACYAVPYDFAKPPSERLLFPKVRQEETPESAGHAVPGSIASIRANISHLYERILGEEASEAEVDAAYQLYLDTWHEGYGSKLKNDWISWPCGIDPYTGQGIADAVRKDPDFTVRAWMAVATYLFADAKVLYE